MTGIAQSGEAQAAALAVDLERERQRAAAAIDDAERSRTRATNCEHYAAASDRALGEYRAEVGAHVTAQLDAYQENAREELNTIVANERRAALQAEAAAAQNEAYLAQSAAQNQAHLAQLTQQRAREEMQVSEAYW